VHDDIVDEVSQVVIYITGNGPLKFETVSWGYGAPLSTNPSLGGQMMYNQNAMIGNQNGVFTR
jgi:hypothetical protein